MKEKILEVLVQTGLDKKLNDIQQIADDYAIEFGLWLSKKQIYYERYWTREDYEDLLKEFKKEKGL